MNPLIKLLFTVDSDEDDEPGPSTPVNIILPKRKDEDKKAEILAAKKEFARKLAEIKFMMEQDSDSSDDDSSEDDSSDDSDYETSSSPDPDKRKVNLPFKNWDRSQNWPNRGHHSFTHSFMQELPKNMPPPPKPGMVLVKKKRAAPVNSNNEEADAKKKRIDDLKALESKMKSKASRKPYLLNFHFSGSKKT